MRSLFTMVVGLALVGGWTQAKAEEPAKESLIGTANEETLRDAALKIEREAAEKFDPKKAAAPKPVPGEKKRAKRPKPLSAADQELYRLELLAARNEALPLWADLLKRFPNGRYSTQALYHAGVLYAEDGDTTQAIRAFDDLIRKHPLSPWTGDALVRQYDVVIEQEFDVRAAKVFLERAIRLARSQQPENKGAPKPAVQPPRKPGAAANKVPEDEAPEIPPERRWDDPSGTILNDLYFRAGVLAFVQEDWGDAASYLNGLESRLPKNNKPGGLDMQRIGVEHLRACAERKTVAWEEDSIQAAGSNKQKVALLFADTYSHGQRTEKAEGIYRKVLAGNAVLGQPNKATEAYCYMRLALVLDRYIERGTGNSKNDPHYLQALEYYKKFYEPDYADAPCAASAILRLAVLENNTDQNHQRSMERYQYILQKYPKARDAERALYFLAGDAIQVGDKALAEKCCREYLKKYSNSDTGWKDHVEKMLNEEIPKMKDKPAAKKKKAKGS